jgi:leucyl aminopeptidase
MSIKISAQNPDFAALNTPLLVLAMGTKPQLTRELSTVDKATGGALGRALKARDFRGARDEVLFLGGAASGIRRVLLVGTGKGEPRTDAVRRAATLAARRAGQLGTGALAFYAGALDGHSAEAAVVGLMAGAWHYDEVRTPLPKEEQRAPVTSGVVLAPRAASLARGIEAGVAIGEGQALARTLGMMPGYLCKP